MEMNMHFVEQVTNACNVLFADQKDFKLQGDEYNYGHLPLCVIDAVFSIGVRYQGVQNTVNHFCEFAKIDKTSRKDELTITQSLALIGQMPSEDLVEKVFKNRQRTSSNNGVLKAEAVVSFLKVLKKYEVERLTDIDKVISNDAFDTEIKKIKGQNSGISLKYFFMLAGSEDLIKPDRMIVRFLESKTGKQHSYEICQMILAEVCERLKKLDYNLTPRELDNLIWNYQRTQTTTQQDDPNEPKCDRWS